MNGSRSDRLEVGPYIQKVVGALPGNHRVGPVDSAATGLKLGFVGRLAKDILASQRHAECVACPPRGLKIDKNLAAKSLNVLRIGEVCRIRVAIVAVPVDPAQDIEPLPPVA